MLHLQNKNPLPKLSEMGFLSSYEYYGRIQDEEHTNACIIARLTMNYTFNERFLSEKVLLFLTTIAAEMRLFFYFFKYTNLTLHNGKLCAVLETHICQGIIAYTKKVCDFLVVHKKRIPTLQDSLFGDFYVFTIIPIFVFKKLFIFL